MSHVHRMSRIFLVLCCLPALAGFSASRAASQDWPQWRGPEANGVAHGANPPTEWNEEKNVRWKVEVPGRGHASPVVWKDRVYLLSAVPLPADPAPEAVETADDGAEGGGENDRSWMNPVDPEGDVEFVLLAYDRESGALAWKRTAAVTRPHDGTHGDATWASASVVTDGEHLVAFFGSMGLFVYDMSGELQWQKDLGDMQTRNGFGEGASPALYGDRLVVNWDHEGDSFIAVFDKSSGEEVWRRDRDEVTSWSTPIVEVVEGKPQVIVSATGKVLGYDLATGDVLWHTGGMTVNVVPSPFEVDGIVYAASGFRGAAVRAVRLSGASGEVTSATEGTTSALEWSFDEDAPYVPTPVVYDGTLYMMKSNSGILTALDARTGAVRYGPVRVPGIDNIYSSLVAADGRVYIVGRGGTTTVVKAGETFEVLAENALDENFDASPAIAGGELYLRGSRHLYAIAARSTASPEAP